MTIRYVVWKNITVDIGKERNRLEVYRDVLSLINDELVKRKAESIPIQYVSNMLDHEILKYLEVLEMKGFLHKTPLSLTQKGKQFLKDFNKIEVFLKEWNIYQDFES